MSVNAVECPEESTNRDAQFLALTIREEFLAEKYIKKTMMKILPCSDLAFHSQVPC